MEWIKCLLVLISVAGGIADLHSRSTVDHERHKQLLRTRDIWLADAAADPMLEDSWLEIDEPIIDETEDEIDPDSGLFPVVFNLARRAKITANATCGGKGPEQYCRLVEHVQQRYGASGALQCSVCSEGNHPIENAIDGTRSWWQSPSIAQGFEYHSVTVTLDLQQVYQVAYVVFKAANSPRPGNWVLEKSVDGVHYQPWQYFALTDSDCWTKYGLPPTIGIPRFKSDDDVICTSYYSRLNPLTDGEIYISLVNGRSGIEEPTQALLDFTTTRYIRFRLERIKTLNADLMTLAYSSDARYVDPTVTNRYYYSIKDISVGGQCICYGHARYCPVDQTTGELKCDCEANTCGNSCEKCCPLHNQQPWKPGTFSEAAVCEECQCYGHAEACEYNTTVADLNLSINNHGEYLGGGVCIDCKNNRMGINCELCQDGFYLPVGVDPRHPHSCRQCLCEGPGASGMCIKDDSRLIEGIQPGDCLCREGFCGPHCEQCAPGYRSYPICEACDCDKSGSLNTDTCGERCMCKANVRGERCDRCMEGTYNLQVSNPEGCDPCFCFGITDTCSSSASRSTMIHAMVGWEMTDVIGSGNLHTRRTHNGGLYMNTADMSSLNSATYWSAPKQFTGNRVKSYGGSFSYTFSYGTNTTVNASEPYMANPDVIIEGSGMRLGYNGEYFDEDVMHTMEVVLTAANWRHLENSTSHANSRVRREQFILALGNVRRMLIRSAYHYHQTTVFLHDVAMDTASKGGTGDVMGSVEMCHCPTGYTGTSCERCVAGYRRVGSVLLGGTCEPCRCNGHAQSCDPYTGECYECQHNTQGGYCEDCAFGFYGEATLGTHDACKPCACPLVHAENNFAQGCIPSAQGSRDYMCIGCKMGFDGEFCERCSAGFFGNPMVPGNYCLPCNCHGNADPGFSDMCDSVSGQCHQCTGMTGGHNCERCVEGYYGAADHGDCRPCSCDPKGSSGALCDHETGQCRCLPRYGGRDCAECKPGYGNVELGCPHCKCDVVGSVSENCDSMTGQCPCRPGVSGIHCDHCTADHHGFSTDGCQSCNCDPFGAVSSACDSFTGECQCKPNVIGVKCNQCQVDHWGFTSDEGCSACNCSSVGAESSQCNPYTGECTCHTGIEPPHCEQCIVGYYGFSQYGCKKCGKCPLPGQVCDPEDGDCVCPTNTEGSECERCVVNTWGYDAQHGCKMCNCTRLSSASLQCDLGTGQCECRNGYRGQKCDECPAGYFDFPFCAPCGCDPSGVDLTQCETETCGCSTDGQCPCKDYVIGDKCRNCVEGSFSLRSDNPKGCTDCFCFGKSDQCKQAPYAWNTRSAPSHSIEVFMSSTSNLHPSSHGFIVVPDGTEKLPISPDHAHLPLYWTLPSTMHKDQTLSYNGYLRFSTAVSLFLNDRDEGNTAWPLVHLIGNFRLHLYYHPLNGVGEGMMQDHSVLMREDQWRDSTGSPVSREVFMIALQNVHHWLIKVADSAENVEQARIYDITLEVAQPITDNEDINAWGIEQCQCPPEYDGLSCQNPATGYYRERPDDFLDRDDPMSLIGDSMPCICYGHSTACDPDTGVCMNCQHNTYGDNCEFCVDGYYGDATTATPSSCHRCGCPLTLTSNNFSPTCIHDVYTGDYVCDACPEGYEGVHCERCSFGYYGSPSAYGSSCQPCACSVEGSRGEVCDEVTGQCPCFSGIEGRKCDQCMEHHVVVNGRCEYCLDGCTGEMHNYYMDIYRTLDAFNASASALLPWARINMLETQIPRLRGVLKASNMTAHRDIYTELNKLRQRAREVASKSLVVMGNNQGDAKEMENKADEIAREAETFVPEIEETNEEMTRFVEDLKKEVDEKLMSDANGVGNVDDALAMAEAILREAQRKDFYNHRDTAREALWDAQAILDRVKNMEKKYDSANTTVEAEMAKNVTQRLEDLLATASATQLKNKQTKNLGYNNQAALDELKAVLAILAIQERDVKYCISNASAVADNASHALWNESSANYQASVDMLAELRAARQRIEEKVGLLEQNLPVSKQVLDEALAHARELEERASSLSAQFEETKMAAKDPLKAANVYDDIKNAIDRTEEAVMQAKQAANNATDAANDLLGGPLVDQAKEALNQSKDFYDDSRAIQNKMGQLGTELYEHVNQNEETDANNRKEEQKVEEIHQALDALHLDLTNKAQDTSEKAADILNRVADVQTKVNQRARQVDEELRPKLQELLNVQEEGLREAHKSVTAAERRFSQINNLTSVLETRHAEIERVGKDLTHNILALKEKILIARAQANSIKVSLSHRSTCARRYELKPEPSTSNSITLFFKTNDTAQPMSLFMLNNPNNSDFLALELVQGRVRMAWNAGAGVTSVVHDLLIQPSSSKSEADQWYQVSAKRISNVGHLSVKRLSDKKPAFVVNATAPGSHTQISITEDSHLYLGGLPQSYQLPGDMEGRGFAGCMGGVSMDGLTYGMYNFRQLEGDGCKGCLVVPVPAPSSGGVFHIDGSGYVEVPQIRYDSSRYSILLQFKGFWEDALLFFASNPQNGDFISLELRAGRVVFSFGTDFQTLLSLTTRFAYNTNEWVRVRAQRLGRQGLLDVAEETVTDSAPYGARERLLLANAKVFIGGIPKTIDADRFGITKLSFLGCLREVQLVSRSSSVQDLLAGKFVGLQAGCPNPANEIGFNGDGHVELPSSDLPRDGGFGFSFRTLNPNGLILLAEGQKDENFYSVSLSNGRLSAWFNAGSGVVTIDSDKIYSDGTEHSVNVVKENRLIEMFVDDELAGMTRLPSGAARINSMKGDEGGLFIGGVDSVDSAQGKAASLENFDGCIKNLISNGELAVLNSPVNFNKADVGRCDASRLFPNMTESEVDPTLPSFTVTVTFPGKTSTTPNTELTTTTVSTTPLGPTVHPTSCALEANPDFVESAVAFGDLKNSHAEVVLDKGEEMRDFNMSLEFRSFHEQGVIFYIENLQQSQYIAVQMIDGKIRVKFRSQEIVKVIQSEVTINEGRWHEVQVVKDRRAVKLQVNGELPRVEEISRRLDVNASVFVGGFPKTFVPAIGVEGESFKGCMRKFSMNGREVDLANSKAIMGVRQCFSHVEPGIHFDGYGYAVYSDRFRIQNKFRVTLDFRTVRREGVILSISHPFGDPALALELYEGKLYFRAIVKGVTIEAVAGDCEFCLCDDRWHSATAEYSGNEISLQVDQSPADVGSAEGKDMVLNTNYPLYLGGFPVYDPQGGLRTGEYFHGCLRNVRINETLVHWHGMSDLVDVHVSACPRPHMLLW